MEKLNIKKCAIGGGAFFILMILIVFGGSHVWEPVWSSVLSIVLLFNIDTAFIQHHPISYAVFSLGIMAFCSMIYVQPVFSRKNREEPLAIKRGRIIFALTLLMISMMNIIGFFNVLKDAPFEYVRGLLLLSYICSMAFVFLESVGLLINRQHKNPGNDVVPPKSFKKAISQSTMLTGVLLLILLPQNLIPWVVAQTEVLWQEAKPVMIEFLTLLDLLMMNTMIAVITLMFSSFFIFLGCATKMNEKNVSAIRVILGKNSNFWMTFLISTSLGLFYSKYLLGIVVHKQALSGDGAMAFAASGLILIFSLMILVICVVKPEEEHTLIAE